MGIHRMYEVSLNNKLNELWYQGATTFERWELLSWFGKERITNAVWTEIKERWDAFYTGSDAPAKLAFIPTSEKERYLVVIKEGLIDFPTA